MASEILCDKVQDILLSHSEGEELSEEVFQHIVCCEKCRSEKEKLDRTRELTRLSSPKCPELREAVLDRIRNENINIDVPKKKRHFPIGTLAAAAAVLVVYISVYGSKLPALVFKNSNEAMSDAAIREELDYADEEIIADAVEESAAEPSDAAENGIVTYSLTDTTAEFKTRSSIKQGERLLSAKLPTPTGTIMGAVNDTAQTDGASGGGVFDKETEDLLKDSVKLESTQAAELEAEAPEAEAETEVETEVETETQAAEKDILTAFGEYSSLYPDSISEEDIEDIGWDIYEKFVEAVEKGEAEYTLEAFKEFAQK